MSDDIVRATRLDIDMWGHGVTSQPRKPFETEIKRFLESTQWFD